MNNIKNGGGVECFLALRWIRTYINFANHIVLLNYHFFLMSQLMKVRRKGKNSEQSIQEPEFTSLLIIGFSPGLGAPG